MRSSAVNKCQDYPGICQQLTGIRIRAGQRCSLLRDTASSWLTVTFKGVLLSMTPSLLHTDSSSLLFLSLFSFLPPSVPNSLPCSFYCSPLIPLTSIPMLVNLPCLHPFKPSVTCLYSLAHLSNHSLAQWGNCSVWHPLDGSMHWNSTG